MAAEMSPAAQELLYNDTLPIDSIIVGERRRKEYGDIGKLAESIKQRGLLHPIVIDGENRLVAGGRRLAACKMLGWIKVPVRSYGSLTDDERDLIELEENLNRLDLSSDEQTRTLKQSLTVVKAAEVAARVNKRDLEIRAKSAQNSSKGGRPAEPASLRQVAARINVPPKTIHNAQTHVAAAEKYPEVAGFTQKDAVATAKNLDKLPEPEREQKRELIRKGDSQTLAELADKPPVDDEPNPFELAKNDPLRRLGENLRKLTVQLVAVDTGPIGEKIPTYTQDQLLSYFDRLLECEEVIVSIKGKFQKELKKYGKKQAATR